MEKREKHIQEKKCCVVRDKIEQPFYYNKKVIDALLAQEHKGIIRIENLILIRSNLERNFEYCFTVNLITDVKTVTLGYLYWGSFNIMRKDVYLKFENERLYDTKELPLEYISKTLGLEMSKLPCVDLAMDFNFNVIEKIYELQQHPKIDVIILNRHRHKKEDIWEQENKGNGSLMQPYKYKGITLKSKDSNHPLTLNGYDKTKEISVKSHKDYIPEIEGFAQIYRLEVRSSRKQLKTSLQALNITDDEFITSLINKDDDVLIKVWKHLFSRILRFRKSGKRECEDIINILFADKISKRTKRKQVIANIKSLLHKARNIADLYFYNLKGIA